MAQTTKLRELVQTTPEDKIDLLDDPNDRRGRKVNKHEALLMALNGKSYQQIGQHFGVSKQAISQLLMKDRADIEAYKAFRQDPATMYEFKEAKIINSLDDDDIKKMSGYQKAGSAGLFRDKVRLERGQSTDIVDHRVISAKLSEVTDRLKTINADFTSSHQSADAGSDNV